MKSNIASTGLALCIATLAVSACAGAGAECAADDECPADATCVAGSCTAIAGEGEGDAAEGEGDAGEGEGGEGEGDGGEGEGDGGEGEGDSQHCSLDDGVLSATDLPVVPGLPLRMVEANSDAADLDVDVDGTGAAGATSWDFTGALPGDGDVQIEAEFLADQWYADTFADEAPLDQAGNGAYVAPLSSDTVAIFRRSQDELVILGVASVDPNTTLITYDPPILVLQFPITASSSWESHSTGSGTFETNPFYASTDDYVSTIDAAGSVVTRAGTFPALRLHLEQTVTVGFFVVSTIQYAWVAPCLGVIAQVTSDSGETDPHFTQAAQVRRLAAP